LERHVKTLGWLWIGYSALIAIAATTGMIIFLTVVQGDDKTAGELLFLALGSWPGVIGGFGLLRRQSWARQLLLILGILNTMAFPVGTALGVFTIWVHFNSKATQEPTT